MKTNKKNYNLFGLAMAVIMGSSCLFSGMGGAFAASADGASARADNSVKISDLEVNGSESPLGIDAAAPVFSWRLSSEARGKSQSAYQITVTENGGAQVWDSGKVTAEINYGVL